ncbi:hypothetical protein DFS28_11618 [Pseudomonas sp. 478]|nr:hypothetical protein DFS28_11618 [Pseudomonas sp. 478]TCV47476.1 hypothetical protein EDB99_116151 [Pseudomonas sp. 460]
MFGRKRVVGCQAAFASKSNRRTAAPTGIGCLQEESGRLSGRHREQAHSHRGSVFAFRFSPLNRPSVSSPAALDPPAPIGRLSGGVHLGDRRAAPFDAVEHIERRSKRSRPEAMPPDEYRNEGTPSLSEGPDAWGEPFWVLFWRLKKVPRRKGETASRRYRRNGYVHLKEIGRLSGRHREQARSHSWTGYIRI